MKAGDYATCLDHLILGQIIFASNYPPGLDNYVLKDYKVIIYVPLYNTETGHFRGIKKWLGFIMVRGDSDEIFYSYGYNEERSKVLYSNLKQLLPNVFQGTAFKKPVAMLIEEKQTQEDSKLFFFLPSTTDHKEEINKFLKMLTFTQLIVRVMILLIIQSKIIRFYSTMLTQEIQLKGRLQEKLFESLKHVAEISKSNLIRNVNSLMAKNEAKINTKVEFSWVSDVHPQNQTKFKLGY